MLTSARVLRAAAEMIAPRSSWAGLRAGALLGLAACSALAISAAEVRVGGVAIPTAEITGALARCSRDAPTLLASDCIERHFVPSWRLGVEAAQRHPEGSPVRREISRGILYERLVESVEVAARASARAEVPDYLAQHGAEFEKPERLRLFRILLASSEEAIELQKQLGPSADLALFRKFARAHSLDKTTHERGGDLGFIAPDGRSDVEDKQVDPALYRAAQAVPDGAFVPEPVAEARPEGPAFAIVWRRGSLPAQKPSPEEARALAEERLLRARVDTELERLIAAARPQSKPDLLARLQRPECKIFER